MFKHALNFLFRQNFSVSKDPFTPSFLLQNLDIPLGISMALGCFRTSYILAK